jgi:hypothetical protein
MEELFCIALIHRMPIIKMQKTGAELVLSGEAVPRF